jgi:hypothetical protein
MGSGGAPACSPPMVQCASGCGDPSSPSFCEICYMLGCEDACATVCGTATIVASESDKPGRIVVDATTVYWADTSSIKSVPKAGGASNTLASAQGATSLALDASFVYWATNNGVFATAKTGGTAVMLAAAQGEPSIAVDDQYLYWGEGSGAMARIMRVTKGGGVPTELANGGAVALAVDSAYVYFADANFISKVPVGGGSVTQLAPAMMSNGFIALDSSYVYWTEYSNGVKRVQVGGGIAEVLVSTSSVSFGLAIDAIDVYWGENNGAVRRVPIGGGAASPFVSAWPAYGLAVDDAYVYWSADGESVDAGWRGVILKAHK